jgi:hypothetical protein
MKNRDLELRKSGHWSGWPLLAAALAAFLWVGAAAAPARADSNFRRGFEDQMGRIMAYEAVNLGKAVIFQGVVHPAVYGGGHASGYGHAPAHAPRPTVYDYRPVPVYTHDHGRRPTFWSGGRDGHPGRHLGHHKRNDHRRDWRHDRHDRHGRNCHH